MAWQNPKTNWSAADGVRNTDFNRIEGNILELYNKTYPPQSNVTIYVATTGNDTTGTGSQASPYRTITKALSVAPKHTNGKLISIYVGAGTYSESVIVSGFTNPVTLTGAASANVTITSMRIDHCKCLLNNINLTASQGITLLQGAFLRTTSNITVSGYTGLNVNGGSVAVIESTLTTNNCTVAGINVEGASHAYVQTQAGTGNNVAAQASGGSILGIFSNASVSFTGARYATSFGGRIYLSAQTNVPSY